MDAAFQAGRWYVADASEAAVVVLDTNGHETRRIGQRGKGPGEFLVPVAVAVRDAHIFVADLGNRRVVQLDTLGQQLQSFESSSPCASGRVSQLRPTATGVWLLRHCLLAGGATVLQVEQSAARELRATSIADTVGTGSDGAPTVAFPLFDVSDSTILLGDGQTGCVTLYRLASQQATVHLCLSELPSIPVPDSLLQVLESGNRGRVKIAPTLPKAIAAHFRGDRLVVRTPIDPTHTRWVTVPISTTRSVDSIAELSGSFDGKSFFSSNRLLQLREAAEGYMARSVRVMR